MFLRKLLVVMVCSLLVQSTVVTVIADDEVEPIPDPLPSMWEGPIPWQPHGVPVESTVNSAYEMRALNILPGDVIVPARKGRVAIVVDSRIFNAVSDKITVYANDLAADGFSSTIINFSGTHSYLKTQLVNLYNEQEGLVGAVLIGRVPYVIFERYDHWSANSEQYTDFPCDFYYMDMDGTWSDTLEYKSVHANNGKLDTWEGDHRVEIWVSRIKTDNLSKLNSTEVNLIKSYFARNHQMRGNIFNKSFMSLAYPDDDWSGMGPGDKDAQAHVYDRDLITMINDPDETTPYDYQHNRLTTDYQLIQIRSHGWPGGHSFASVNDYVRIDPQTSFWSLFVCSGCDFSYNNCLGLITAFNDEGKGLLTWGSTKTGGMMWDVDFYGEIGNGECAGEAFIRWFNKRYQWEGNARWDWGMVLLGDGSLGSAMPVYDMCVSPWSDAKFSGLMGSSFPNARKI